MLQTLLSAPRGRIVSSYVSLLILKKPIKRETKSHCRHGASPGSILRLLHQDVVQNNFRSSTHNFLP